MSQLGILGNTGPGGLTDVVTLTGNSGGAVPADASGNINTLGTGSITVVGSPGTNTLTAQLTGLTNHNVLVGAGTATITKVPPSTAGFVLTSNGPAADPSFQAVGAGVYSITTINNTNSPYTVLSTDEVIECDSSAGAISILLPNAPSTGRIIIIKDYTGGAATNNVTITTVGGVVNLDNATSMIYRTAFFERSFIFDGTRYLITLAYEGPIIGAPKNVNTTLGSSAGNTTFASSTTNATLVGYQAGLALNTSGVDNTFIGYQAGTANTSGTGNVCVGSGAGKTHTATIGSTLVGFNAGNVSITNPITAIGYQAGLLHTNGTRCTYYGYQSGASNLSSTNNTFVGFQSGNTATSASNTCVGSLSGSGITSGAGNTCIGSSSGTSINTGASHTLIGANTGITLGAGSTACTAVGSNVLNLCTGSSNTIVGAFGGQLISTGSVNCAMGQNTLVALLTGTRNTCFGTLSGQSYNGAESNNILLGYAVTGTAGENNVLRIGQATGTGNGQVNTCIINGIGGVTQDPTATNKVITLNTSNSQLGVTLASATPTASKIPLYDANLNLSANSMLMGYATTATAAGTTTLVVGSAEQQFFTGATTQTVKLPVTSTLALGQQYMIYNMSTGVVTVQSSGANTLQAMSPNTMLVATVILTSGTTTASWTWNYMTMMGQGMVSVPANSNTVTAGFGTSLTAGTSVQNTLNYDIQVNICVAVSSSTTATIVMGVGSATGPTTNTVIPSFTVAATTFFTFTAIVPDRYWLVVNTTGTIVVASITTQACAL